MFTTNERIGCWSCPLGSRPLHLTRPLLFQRFFTRKTVESDTFRWYIGAISGYTTLWHICFDIKIRKQQKIFQMKRGTLRLFTVRNEKGAFSRPVTFIHWRHFRLAGIGVKFTEKRAPCSKIFGTMRNNASGVENDIHFHINGISFYKNVQSGFFGDIGTLKTRCFKYKCWIFLLILVNS